MSNGLGLKEYTEAGVEEAMTRYWPCVDEHVSNGAQRVSLAGVPISSQLGRARVLSLLDETQRTRAVVADAATEAIIAGLEHLGIRRIAIASRWAKELNDKLVAYLDEAGIETLAITSENQWAKEASAMSLEYGIMLAAHLGRQAMRQAPAAQGLLLPGGAWRSLAVVPLLEEDFGRPVITNGMARAWRLIHERIAPPKLGWGTLLATP
jgi:arylmalonate decarboxylase